VIVVDTSVWIDVLNGSPSPAADRCVALIEAGEPVALTDVIFAEILQGLRSDPEADQVEQHLRASPSCGWTDSTISPSPLSCTRAHAAAASPSAGRSIA
jgi:predicted nucleic acid-binding protein